MEDPYWSQVSEGQDAKLVYAEGRWYSRSNVYCKILLCSVICLFYCNLFELQEGEKFMEKMVEDCKNLAKDGLTDDDLEKHVVKLKQEALNFNNPYINTLLS